MIFFQKMDNVDKEAACHLLVIFSPVLGTDVDSFKTASIVAMS